MHVRVNLTRQDAHDGVRLHVKEDASTRFQKSHIDLGPAADHVAPTSGRLHHNLLISDLLEDVAHRVADALQVLDVVLGSLKLLLLLVTLVLLLQELVSLLGQVLLNLNVVLQKLCSVNHFL